MRNWVSGYRSIDIGCVLLLIIAVEIHYLELSVIIVNYRVPVFLEQCILSVKRSMQQIAGEIIVVDNASDDKTVEQLRETFPDVSFYSFRPPISVLQRPITWDWHMPVVVMFFFSIPIHWYQKIRFHIVYNSYIQMTPAEP